MIVIFVWIQINQDVLRSKNDTRNVNAKKIIQTKLKVLKERTE
jgi:hypothetical protein